MRTPSPPASSTAHPGIAHTYRPCNCCAPSFPSLSSVSPRRPPAAAPGTLRVSLGHGGRAIEREHKTSSRMRESRWTWPLPDTPVPGSAAPAGLNAHTLLVDPPSPSALAFAAPVVESRPCVCTAYLYICTYMCIYAQTDRQTDSTHTHIYLSIYLSIHLSIHLSMSISISIHLSIYMYIHTYVYMENVSVRCSIQDLRVQTR